MARRLAHPRVCARSAAETRGWKDGRVLLAPWLQLMRGRRPVIPLL